MNNPLTCDPHVEVTIPKYLFCSKSPTNSLTVIKTGYILDVIGLVYEIIKTLIFYLAIVPDTKGGVWFLILPLTLFCWLCPYLSLLSSYQKFKPDPHTQADAIKKGLNLVFHVILNAQAWLKLRLAYSTLQILWSLWSFIWLSIY
jgi:hypothetical protein